MKMQRDSVITGNKRDTHERSFTWVSTQKLKQDEQERNIQKKRNDQHKKNNVNGVLESGDHYIAAFTVTVFFFT